MAWAILERTSGFEPSSETTAPRYLKLVYSVQLLSFHLNLPLDAISVLFLINLVFSALFSILYRAGFVETFKLGLLVPAHPQL